MWIYIICGHILYTHILPTIYVSNGIFQSLVYMYTVNVVWFLVKQWDNSQVECSYMYLEMYCLNPTSPLMLIRSYCFRVVVFFKHILFLNLYIHYNMTVHVIKHYTNNRWKWDFDGSHTAYDVVSQIIDQYKYDDRCKIYTDLSS